MWIPAGCVDGRMMEAHERERTATSLDGILDIEVFQHREGYRFSVDALLLYSFVQMKHAGTIIDLGAGSGIIGLLLARKYKTSRVVLVELQQSLVKLAERNVVHNGLGARVRVEHADIINICDRIEPMSSDLVVSNPPFRTVASGRLSLGEERAVARHEMRLRLPDLAEAASSLLGTRGRFCMIYHPERIADVIAALRENRLEPKRIRFVHNTSDAVSKIVLVEAVKEGRAGLRVERPLLIYNKDGSYTKELRDMYGMGD
jgi:tRNA1Val (adenine37-N6)-methyltransferase